jgi:hypothetical protein
MKAAAPLTLMPSNRDRALRGRSARNVRSDLMGPISAKPRVLATRLTRDTYGRKQRLKDGDSSRDRWQSSCSLQTGWMIIIGLLRTRLVFLESEPGVSWSLTFLGVCSVHFTWCSVIAPLT